MPISSTEISNILQSQIGMFSSSSQYAQAVSAQHGFQSMGGMGVNDPRSVTHPSRQATLAGNVAGGFIQGAGYAAGAVGLTSAFQFGPRILDPFAQVIHSASRGYRLGGMGGAIGAGAIPAAGFLAAGSAFNYASNQVLAGAQGRSIVNSQIGTMFPGMGMNQVNQTSGMVESMSRRGMGSLNELTTLMNQGRASGMLNAGGMSEFQSSFRKLVQNVRQVANVMNTSINEAHQAMAQVKGLGVSSDRAAGFITSMRGLGRAGGLSPQEMLMSAAQGSQMAQGAGINRELGAMGAMRTSAMLSMVERDKLIGGVTADSQGRFTSAAFRFLGSRRGRSVLGAMMTSGGGFNEDVAAQIASGSISPAEIRRMSASNLRGRGSRDLFRSRSSELAATFVSQFGPEGIASTVSAIADKSGMPESMRSRLTGLNRSEFSALEQLGAQSGTINSRLTQEALSSFKEGQRKLGLGEAAGLMVEKLVKPLKDKFRQMGADLTEAVSGALSTATNEFLQNPPPAADPKHYVDAVRKSISTGRSAFSSDGMSFSGGLNLNPGGVAGFLRNNTPAAFRVLGGGMQPGTSLSDLPMFGFGGTEYSPERTALTASVMGLGPRGGTAMGLAGSALGAGGRFMRSAFDMDGSGFMRLGGIGTWSGSARMAGVGMGTAGLGMRGLGFVGSKLGGPLAMYDAVTNIMPAMERRLGLAPVTAGALTGDNAELVRHLAQSGALSEDALATLTVGSEGIDAAGARRSGMTPISGTFTPRAGAGSQDFLTKGGMSEIDALFRDSASLDDLRKKHGTGSIADLTSKLRGMSDLDKIETLLTEKGIKDPKERARLMLSASKFTKTAMIENFKKAQENVAGSISSITDKGLEAAITTNGVLDRDKITTLRETLGPLKGAERLAAYKGLLGGEHIKGVSGSILSRIGFGETTDELLSKDADLLVKNLGILDPKLGRVAALSGSIAKRDIQERLSNDFKKASSIATDAGSMSGISGLAEIVGGFGAGDNLVGSMDDAKAKLQVATRGMSPSEKARLARNLRGSLQGDELGNFLGFASRFESMVGKSKDPNRMFRTLTGETGTMSKGDRDFLSGKGGFLSQELTAHLKLTTRRLFDLSPDDKNFDAMYGKVFNAYQGQARGEKGDVEALVRSISTSKSMVHPNAGKSGSLDETMSKIQTAAERFQAALQSLTNKVASLGGDYSAGAPQ